MSEDLMTIRQMCDAFDVTRARCGSTRHES